MTRLAVVLLALPLLLAQAGAVAIPDSPARARTSVIIVSPPPSPAPPGQTIILERDRAGRTRVTMCGWTAGVLRCTR